MIKRIMSYSNDDSKLHDLDIEKAMQENLGTIWIDIIDPKIEELDTLQTIFNFHPLTIEDCLEANQRPKLEEYPDYLFIILAGIRKDPERNELEQYQLAFYIGANYVITVREKRGGISLKRVHNKILLKNKRLLSYKSGFLAYTIIDAFIDGYLELLEEIEDVIEDIEETVVQRAETELLDKIFDLRTDLLILIKAIRPQRVVIHELAVENYPLVSEFAQSYFSDIYDHALEATDLSLSYRDRVSGILQIYLSSASNRMNDTMRLIAVLTAVVTIPNLLASIGGVNFRDFAEKPVEVFLTPPFWIFLGTLVIVTIIIVIIFRKMKL